MGQEGSTPFLKNRYWILRHGRSVPNERNIFVATLENGVLAEYGLTPEGVKQAESAGEKFRKVLKANGIRTKDVRICYSPFSRTTQTAKAVAKALGVPFPGVQCKAMNELRERYFGSSLEKSSQHKYADIMAMDEIDPRMRPQDGESVIDVVSRLTAALSAVEAEFQGCTILLISHGDPLQILQTVMYALNDGTSSGDGGLESRIRSVSNPEILSRHWRFGMHTAELRLLA